MATLTGYIFGMKPDIHKWASVLQTTMGLLRRLKMSWSLVHKRLKNGSEFLPNLRKFCILLYCRASQMARSANRTQPNCAKRCTM